MKGSYVFNFFLGRGFVFLASIAVALLLSSCNAVKTGRVVGNVVAAASVIDQMKSSDDDSCITRGGLPTLDNNGTVYCRWESDKY